MPTKPASSYDVFNLRQEMNNQDAVLNSRHRTDATEAQNSISDLFTQLGELQDRVRVIEKWKEKLEKKELYDH